MTGGGVGAHRSASARRVERGFSDPSSFSIGLYLRQHYDSGPAREERLLDLAVRSAREGRVDTFFISDTVAGERVPAQSLAREVLQKGAEPVLSVTVGDRPRAEVLDSLRSCREKGIGNILLVTGDYPRGEEKGKPFFDLDSVQLFMLLEEASAEEDFPRDFFKGCVVSPFKTLEAEQAWQYARLVRKVKVGADFIVSQAGYDARKWDELIRFCRLTKIDKPVIGNVLVPDPETLRRVEEGLIPGVKISPAFADRAAARQGGASGKEAGLRSAAAAMAVMRGLGYDGALLGGSDLGYDEISFILDEEARLAPRWRECIDEFMTPEKKFYYFSDEGAGLNDDRPGPVEPQKREHPLYVISHIIDYVAFGSSSTVFQLLVRVCRFCDPRPFWKRALWLVEYISKYPLYRCRMCGDCTLYACGFLCAESGCPKRMVNGPCGGSLDGYCEVYPGKTKCFWVKVYGMLKGTAERPFYPTVPIPPRDRRLDRTCSWINFCLGRDHRKMKA
jgi:methylenetetrahydrofolate reductase (NADPH)